MILKIFSVFDSKVGAYLPPMYMRSKPEAIRAFGSAANATDHDFYKYAEDYTLFELGEWDDSSAKFNLHLTPIPLGKAMEHSSKHLEYYAAAAPNTEYCEVSGAKLDKVG